LCILSKTRPLKKLRGRYMMEWLIRTTDAKAALGSSRFFIFFFIFLPKGY
jgi:hypothetical protein